jgi:Tol biopolymer transport system component
MHQMGLSRARLITVVISALGLAAAIGSPARAQTESGWAVVESYQLDVMAGPAGRGAVLSPDGSKFLYNAGRRDMCVYDLQGQGECFNLEGQDPDLSRLDGESLRWSPDGQYIVGTVDFFRDFREPDIWLIDAETDEFKKLTDDLLEVWSPSDDLPSADVLPQFAANDPETVYFMRYTRTRANPDNQPQLWKIGTDGADGEQVATFTGTEPFEGSFPIFEWTLSDDGQKVAYSATYYGNGSQRNQIYVMNPDGSDRLLVANITHPITTIRFSADNKYLLLSASFRGQVDSYTPDNSSVSILSVSGESFLADSQHYVRTAGWSPDGTAYAYIVYNPQEPDTQGLYIADAPGEPGTLVLPGLFIAPTTNERQGLIWASNNVILLSGSLTYSEREFNVTVVQLERN